MQAALHTLPSLLPCASPKRWLFRQLSKSLRDAHTLSEMYSPGKSAQIGEWACDRLTSSWIHKRRMLYLPSASPFRSAKRINPGVSSRLLLRSFHTASKSGPFAGCTWTFTEASVHV